MDDDRPVILVYGPTPAVTSEQITRALDHFVETVVEGARQYVAVFEGAIEAIRAFNAELAKQQEDK